MCREGGEGDGRGGGGRWGRGGDNIRWPRAREELEMWETDKGGGLRQRWEKEGHEKWGGGGGEPKEGG